MQFHEAIQTCFIKYANFNGRASRSEYWWFFLFVVLVNLAAGTLIEQQGAITGIITLALFCRTWPCKFVACTILIDLAGGYSSSQYH